ncbi:hydrogenase maturation nickel metallochaperone HypA [Desulfococcus sp.]|uniref:hydrogenase maturation nickel metallochaperone HypA/HybF n=1 Tax=Desulfococcus sp. TaxID=2025834 RepID=UPI003594721C
MHEMGIAMQVVEIATAAIPEDMAGSRVERVNLRVGKLSAVVPDSLRFCYDVIVRDTPLANSTLNIQEIPVSAKCGDCGHEWIAERPEFLCARCGGGSVQIVSGQELEIVSIDIADA